MCAGAAGQCTDTILGYLPRHHRTATATHQQIRLAPHHLPLESGKKRWRLTPSPPLPHTCPVTHLLAAPRSLRIAPASLPALVCGCSGARTVCSAAGPACGCVPAGAAAGAVGKKAWAQAVHRRLCRPTAYLNPVPQPRTLPLPSSPPRCHGGAKDGYGVRWGRPGVGH